MSSELTWWGGTATFDGAGNCTAFVAGVNDNGVITPPGAPAPLGSYTVAADGTLVWTSGIGGPWHGGLFGGGGTTPVGPLPIVLPLTGTFDLAACDTAARIVLAPAELPVGVITALIGAPLFIILLKRSRK